MDEKFKKFFKGVYQTSEYSAEGHIEHPCLRYAPSEVLDYLKSVGEEELCNEIIEKYGEPEF